MASKNSVKLYLNNSYYHIYNRGVEQRNIFMDKQDYSVFLSYLQTYLLPKNTIELKNILSSYKTTYQEKDRILKQLRLNNYSENIELICFALLPNHYHLLIRQAKISLNKFMNSLGTRYAMYFNRKYKRKGVLFQDVYKAVLVESNDQLLHLSRYIHLNITKAVNISPERWKESIFPSSLPEFLGLRKTNWIKTKYILDHFSKYDPKNNYEDFMINNQEKEHLIQNVSIDIDED